MKQARGVPFLLMIAGLGACSSSTQGQEEVMDPVDAAATEQPLGTGGAEEAPDTTGGSPLLVGGAPGDGGTGQGAAGQGAAPSGTGGETASGGAPDPGLELVGPAPERAEFPATQANWTLLADTSEFTDFSGENPFAVLPLRSQNFPEGYDYCHAPGGDAELNDEQQFARAELKADLKTWYYDVTLIAVPEEDGLTPYQLVIDGVVVREFTSPATGTMGAEDRKDFPHVWPGVPIEAGQTIEIRARAQSNLEITEGANCREGAGFDETYAWARGRFNGLILEAGSAPE